MADITAEEYFPHDTYHTQWFLFWVIAVVSGVLLYLSFYHPTPVTVPPRVAPSAGIDWFLVLHMPEVPSDPVRTAHARVQFAGWLDALARNGYHPMLLSDVENRLQEGAGLPDRSVVLVFDPGYNHTYQTLASTLVQYRFPALWVTDRTAILRGDRHFIHTRTARWMVNSGFWDLGYTGDGFWGHASPEEIAKIHIRALPTAQWAPKTGRTALNWGSDLTTLNRLDVGPKWSTDDLIDRLTMEIPLHNTVRLGMKRIQHHAWGIVIESPRKDSTFALHTPLSGTVSSVYWLGTRGAGDVRLSVVIPSFFGELFFWLRSETRTGQGIGVGFSKDHIFVDQRTSEGRRRLIVASREIPGPWVRAVITLSGTELRVEDFGSKPLEVRLAPQSVSNQGMVRFVVYDHIRGAGHANVKELELTPLTSPNHP